MDIENVAQPYKIIFLYNVKEYYVNHKIIPLK